MDADCSWIISGGAAIGPKQTHTHLAEQLLLLLLLLFRFTAANENGSALP